MGSFVSSPGQVCVDAYDVYFVSGQNLIDLDEKEDEMWKMRHEAECASDMIGCENEEIEAKKRNLVRIYDDAFEACTAAQDAIVHDPSQVAHEFHKCICMFTTWKYMRELYLIETK